MNSSSNRWIVLALAIGLMGLALYRWALPDPVTAPDPRQELLSADGTSELRILPDPPKTYHALRLSGEAVRASVANQLHAGVADAPRTEVVWEVNGQEVHRGRQLDSQHFRRDDEIRARVESRSAEGEVTVHGTAHTRVVNARPQLRSVTIQRDGQAPNLVRAHVRADDADEDLLHFEYVWKADGRKLSGKRGERVPTDDLDPGASLTVEVVADDGTLRSDPMESRPVTLSNHAPVVATDGTPRTEHDEEGNLIATMPIRVRDADGDAVEVRLVDAPEGFRYDTATRSVVWTVTSGEEVVEIAVEAVDARGATATRTFSVRR